MNAIQSAVDLAEVRRCAQSGRARALRLAAELSLYDVARVVGVTAPTVFRWETNKRRPHGEPALRYGALLAQLARLADQGAESDANKRGNR